MINLECILLLSLLITYTSGQVLPVDLPDDNTTNSSYAPRINDMISKTHERINGVIVAVAVGGAAVCLVLATGIAQLYRNNKNKKEISENENTTDIESPEETPTPFTNSIAPRDVEENPIDFAFPPPRENSNSNSANSHQPIIKKQQAAVA